MRELVQDLQFAFRIFRRSPGFTLGAIFTLALGFGVNTVVFSVLYGVLLKPLPYPEPDRLAMIWDRTLETESLEGLVTPAEFLAWKQMGTVFTDVTAYSETERSVVLLGKGDPRYLKGSPVFANFFSVLGARPLLGRVFGREESYLGSAPEVILSYRLWRELGADPRIVGKTINLDQLPHEVIGVLPEGFDYPIPGSNVWLPVKWNLRKQPAFFRTAHNIRVIGRLKAGVSLRRAQAALDILAAAEPKSSTADSAVKAGLTPLRDWIAGDRELPLLLLLGAAGLVLLIACVNVTNLQLARAMTRASEIVLRSSLGAPPGRILRQLMTESLLLSILGAGMGFLLGLWGLRAVIALSPGLPRTNEIGPSLAVCLFVLAAAVLSSLASGLAPALQSLKPDYQALQLRGALGATGPRQNRIRNLLLIAEVALAAMLMISAGLMLKSFYRLNQIDPGFKPEHILTSAIDLPFVRYRKAERKIAFEQQLLDRMESLPGIQSVALVDCLPLQSLCWTGSLTIEGAPSSPADLEFHHRVVSPEYFKTLGVPLRAGRFFLETDDARAPKVALVNEALAKLYFRNQPPLGRRIRFQREGIQDSGWLTIVGVVGDEKLESLTASPQPEVFEPYLQDPRRETNLVARTPVAPQAFDQALRAEVKRLDPGLPQGDIRSMDDIVAHTLGQQRFMLSLTALFAGLALLLTISGIYALTSYMVVQRTQEVGIRISLGAGKRQILKALTGRTMLLVLIGIGLGVCGALLSSRILQHLLYQIDATDVLTYSVVALSLGLVALLSSLMPARKATRIDPIICLRLE